MVSASSRPVQRTEKLLALTPVPGAASRHSKSMVGSTRVRAGEPVSVVLLKYSACQPVPMDGVASSITRCASPIPEMV